MNETDVSEHTPTLLLLVESELALLLLVRCVIRDCTGQPVRLLSQSAFQDLHQVGAVPLHIALDHPDLRPTPPLSVTDVLGQLHALEACWKQC